MMADLYNSVQAFGTPFMIDEHGRFVPDANKQQRNAENNTNYWDVERARIFGYDTTASISMEVEDINNPTQEELNYYADLTPAQKVLFIQQRFVDDTSDTSLFKNLIINLIHQYEYKEKGFSKQSIRFNDQISDIENLYVAFRSAFFHDNPFVRLASLDLIKYAFIVEGFRFKKGTITKLITNDALIADTHNKGLDIIESIKAQFALYSDPKRQGTTDFIDKFVRSHSNLAHEVYIKRARKGQVDMGNKLARYAVYDSMYYVPFDDSNTDILELLKIDEDRPKDYIRITKPTTGRGRTTTLYKQFYGKQGVYMYPLNLLERNEVSNWSVNHNNNKYLNDDFYKYLIEESEGTGLSIKDMRKNDELNVNIKSYAAESIIPRHKPIKVSEVSENLEEIVRLSNSDNSFERNNANKFINNVNKFYNNSPIVSGSKTIVIRNESSTIGSLFPANTSAEQIIPIDGNNVLFRIEKVKMHKYLKRLMWHYTASEKYSKEGGSMNGILTETNKLKYEAALPKMYDNVYEELKKSPVYNTTLYKLVEVSSEEVAERQKSWKAAQEQKRAGLTGLFSITSILDDFEIDF